MADFDFSNIGQYLQPTEDDRQQALRSSLMVAGLGMLANNQGHFGALGPALGAGGLMGMSNYHQATAEIPKARMQGLQTALQLENMKRKFAAQDAFANMGNPPPPPVGSPPEPPPGVTPTAPALAGAAGRSAGPTLEQVQKIMAADPELGKAAMEMYKAYNPGMQVSGGFAYNPRTVQPGFLPQMQVTPQGAAIQVTPNAQGQPEISVPKGSPEAVSQFREIDARMGARFGQPIKVAMPDGTERLMTPEQFSDYNRNAGMRNQPPAAIAPPAAPEQPAAPPQAAPAGGGRLTLVASDEKMAERLMRQYDAQGIPVTVKIAPKKRGGDPAPITEPVAAPAGNTTSTLPRTGDLLGVPGISSGKTTAQARSEKILEAGGTELAGIHAKRIGALEEKIPGLNSTLRRLDRIESLTADDKTYAAAGAELKTQLGSIAQAFGIKVNKDKTANTEDYIANVAELLKERLASKDYGSGTGVSNLDLATAGRPLPEVAKTAQGRQQIITALRADTKRALEDATAAREFFAKNKTLDGFTYPSETENPAPAPAAAPRDAPRTPAPTKSIMKGQVVNGYRYKGGDPNAPTSWIKTGGSASF